MLQEAQDDEEDQDEDGESCTESQSARSQTVVEAGRDVYVQARRLAAVKWWLVQAESEPWVAVQVISASGLRAADLNGISSDPVQLAAESLQ